MPDLYRRIGETPTLRLSVEIDPAILVGELFKAAGVTVGLNWVSETSALLRLEAPRAFKVLRSELLQTEDAA